MVGDTADSRQINVDDGVKVAIGEAAERSDVDDIAPRSNISIPFDRPGFDGTSLVETLVLIPTFRCSAECDNCCFASNPRIHDRAAQSELLAYIAQSTTAFPSLRWLVISGGEPFMLGDDLVELVAHGAAHGLLVRVVTNAYWATTPARTESRLRQLIDVGLCELAVSSGDEHVRFVPQRRVANALGAALDADLSCALSVEATAQSELTIGSFLDTPTLRTALDRNTGPQSLRTYSSPWMQVLDGPVVPAEYAAADNSTVEREPGCQVVLRTAVINPTGHLGLCDGLIRELVPDLRGEVVYGRDIGQLYDRQAAHLLPAWLMVDGPKRILQWAAERDPSIEWEGRYAHNCDACHSVFHDERVGALIAEHATDIASDVAAKLPNVVDPL